MDPTVVVLSRAYAAVLGGGSRSVTATVQCTRTIGTPDVLVTTVTVNEPNGMSSAELADFQTFVALLDEEVTLVEALVILDEEPV